MRQLAFIIFFGVKLATAQVGLSVITLNDSDKGFCNAVYQSLLAGIEKDEALSFTDNSFLVPNSKEIFHKILSSNKLEKIPLAGLKICFQWDTHGDCAKLLCCAPIFKKEGQNIYFWLSGNFSTVFSKDLHALFLNRSKEAFFKLFNLLPQTDSTKNLTIRAVDLKKESSIYHVPFDYLPTLIKNNIMRGNIVAYDSYLFDLPLERPLANSGASSGNKKSTDEFKKALILEEWRDSTVKDFFTFPVFIKKLKGIGLSVTAKTEVWIDNHAYDIILNNEHPDMRETKKNAYKLYLESSFCRAIKAEMYIK